MKPAARIDDEHSCPKKKPTPHRKGTIKEGSHNVIIGGQPAARVGDKIHCENDSEGNISDSNACVIINGKRAARVGDKTDHDGEIKTGFNSVLIADGDPFIEFGDVGHIEIGENVFFGEVVAEVVEMAVGAEAGATAGVSGGPWGALGGAVVGALGILIFYKPPPKDLKAYPDAKEQKKKGPRKRWKDSNKKIYEWDSQHGKVEMYDKTGKHLGEFDPETGVKTKSADKSRKIEP